MSNAKLSKGTDTILNIVSFICIKCLTTNAAETQSYITVNSFLCLLRT